MSTLPNEAYAVDAPVALLFHTVASGRRATDMRRLDQMTPSATAVMAVTLLLLCGCATKREHSSQGPAVVSERALPLAPGETVRLVPTSIADPPDGLEARIDPEGDVCLLLGVKVHVAGLTPTEAAAAIQKAYQPRYFKYWDFALVRVQPGAPPSGGPATPAGDSGVTEGRHR